MKIKSFFIFLGKRLRALMISLCLVFATTIGWHPSMKIVSQESPNQRMIFQNLERIVRVLSENIGIRDYEHYANLNRAADFIEEQFIDLGYEIEVMTYEIDGKVFKNIIAEQSSRGEQTPIIIGAHYDSCSNPGADDNASGVAGMLELARLLKDQKTKIPIRFIAFTNEEPPFFKTDLMGSHVYVQQLEEETIHVAIILEMIGYYSDKPFSQRYPPLLGFFYPHHANYIAVVSNLHSGKFAKALIKYFKHATRFPIRSLIFPNIIPAMDFSDQWSFWQENYPAIMVTDTSFLRNKNYHKSTDLSATLDYKRMVLVVEGLYQGILGLANK